MASSLDLVVSASARTDVGLIRERNEDAVRVGSLAGDELPIDGSLCPIEGSPLAIVCDGMGGEAGGHVASSLAVSTIWSEMTKGRSAESRDILARLLRRSMRRANLAIVERAEAEPALRGMGTTASVAAVAGSTLVLAQVGDSRAYLLRAGKLVQVTRDQSVVAALISAGKLKPSEASLSTAKSLVLQALGAEQDVDVSLSFAELRRGDRLLLCSDGLHGFVSEPAIAHALGGELSDASSLLVQRAHQAGAPDNVSAVVIEFSGQALELPGDDDELIFSELDPSEEGDAAVAHTSRVARKLAARAGLIDEDPEAGLPATGMYPSIDDSGSVPRATPPSPRPAERRLERDGSIGLLAWVMAGLFLAAALAWIWWM